MVNLLSNVNPCFVQFISCPRDPHWISRRLELARLSIRHVQTNAGAISLHAILIFVLTPTKSLQRVCISCKLLAVSKIWKRVTFFTIFAVFMSCQQILIPPVTLDVIQNEASKCITRTIGLGLMDASFVGSNYNRNIYFKGNTPVFQLEHYLYLLLLMGWGFLARKETTQQKLSTSSGRVLKNMFSNFGQY